MAARSKTTAVATTATNVVAPTRSGAGVGPQWLSLVLFNTGSTVIWIALDGETAVAEADETLPVYPGGGLAGVPYMGSFSAIAITSAADLTVLGSDDPAWR